MRTRVAGTAWVAFGICQNVAMHGALTVGRAAGVMVVLITIVGYLLSVRSSSARGLARMCRLTKARKPVQVIYLRIAEQFRSSVVPCAQGARAEEQTEQILKTMRRSCMSRAGHRYGHFVATGLILAGAVAA